MGILWIRILGGIVGIVFRDLLHGPIIFGSVQGRNQDKILGLQEIDVGDVLLYIHILPINSIPYCEKCHNFKVLIISQFIESLEICDSGCEIILNE